ncbi:MAG: c-type cytochrome [Chitinophagaceae bacterium]
MKKFSPFFVLVILATPVLFFSTCVNNNNSSGISAEDSLKQQLEHGKYLVHSVVNCVDCHSQLDMNKFSMPIVAGTEGGGGLPIHELINIPGKIFIPNITPFALKDWTDDEIARAMTKGINKSGDTLFPMMPYHGLSQMAKEDVHAVIAYIRSLKPIENNFPKRELFVPASVFGPLPDNDYKNNVRPDENDKIKYGQYLVTIAHCGDCHTPFSPEGIPDFSKPLSGGNEDKLPGFTVRSANITPDSATGIGSWTEEMFISKFRNNANPENINRNPGKNNTIMPWSCYGNMKENDLKAIYAYLHSIPPISNKVVKWPGSDQQ